MEQETSVIDVVSGRAPIKSELAFTVGDWKNILMLAAAAFAIVWAAKLAKGK